MLKLDFRIPENLSFIFGIIAKFAAIAVLLFLLACGSSRNQIEPEEPQESTEEVEQQDQSAPPKTSKVDIEKLEAGPPVTDIEIVWAIPEKPVEGFILRYGYSREKLDQSVKLMSKDTEKFEDPAHGFAYRYHLRKIQADKSLYVSIAAFDGAQQSAPTDVFEVAAQED